MTDAAAIIHSALLVLSLTAAISYAITVRSPPSLTRMATKTAAISLLALLSTLLNAPTLLIAAQATSACGDAFLAWDGEAAFLSGLASFLTAHVFYISLFSRRGGGAEALLSATWRVGLAGALLVASLGLVARLLAAVERRLRVPIVVYSTALYAMVVSALTMHQGRLIFGAVVFLASDTLLAVGKFLVAETSPHQGWIENSVWVLYYSGQLLIMLDVAPVL